MEQISLDIVDRSVQNVYTGVSELTFIVNLRCLFILVQDQIKKLYQKFY
jgi:hypothetical protein